MAPLAVDPEALERAGAAVISAGGELGSAISTLTAALAGCGGMAGNDPAGATFAAAYDHSTSTMLNAMASTRNGLCRLGDGVRTSAFNYSHADALSNISGRGRPLPAPHQTSPVSVRSSPSAVGGSVAAPPGWGWVARYIGMIWPNGDSAKLRGAAAAWTSAGTHFDLSRKFGAGATGEIAAQHIPEGPAIAAAFAASDRSVTGIAHQCRTVATQLTSLATTIDSVHAAIMDLLSRICNPLTGVKEVWEFLTDQDEDEIKKIADDIRIVVNQFTAEVKALNHELATALHEAVSIMSTMTHYAEKEWEHLLHDTDVGRALDHVGQVCKGVVDEAESFVTSLWTLNPVRAVVDPQGFWHSVSDSVDKMESLTGVDGKQRLEESWKELGKDTVHWDEWSTNPLHAAGESIFDLATVLVPGGAASKLPELGRLAASAAERSDLRPPTPIHQPAPSPATTSAPSGVAIPSAATASKNPMPGYGLAGPTKTTPIVSPKSAEPAPPKQDHYGPTLRATHSPPTAPPPALTDTTPGAGIATPPSAPNATARPAEAPPRLGDSAGGHHDDGHRDDGAVPGLNDAKRDEILAMPKGSRPDPSEYLPREYIEQHLAQFQRGGTRFMLQENLRAFGIGQRDGTTFLFPTSEVDTLVAQGDLVAVENALGLPAGYLKDFNVIRVDIDSPNAFGLRMPSGNEAGANEYWLPGGLLPDGMHEAVIDGTLVPSEALTIHELKDQKGK